MARYPYPDPADMPPELREFVERIDPMPNIFRFMATAETALRPYMRLGNALLFKGELDGVLRELAILRVGHLTDASYEVFQHEGIARRVGVSEAKIAAVGGGEGPAFSEVECLVLRLTDEIVRNVRASEATFKALEAHLGPRELAELVMTIGFYWMTAAFLENFQVELEPPGLIDDPLKPARKP